MLEGLELTEAQKTALHAKLDGERPRDTDHAARKAEHEAHRAEMHQRLLAFAGDAFDATAFGTRPAGEKASGGHGDPVVKMVAAVAPILDRVSAKSSPSASSKGRSGTRRRWATRA